MSLHDPPTLMFVSMIAQSINAEHSVVSPAHPRSTCHGILAGTRASRAKERQVRASQFLHPQWGQYLIAGALSMVELPVPDSL